MGWRNRIVAHGMAPVDELAQRANPSNWRLHPDGQRASLAHLLGDVGLVATVIVNKTTGNMVDGHLRVELAQKEGETELPVTYVELSPEEEEAILVQLDPLTGLAVADTDKLQELMDRVKLPDGALADVLESLTRVGSSPPPVVPPSPTRKFFFEVPDDEAEHVDRVFVDLRKENPKADDNELFLILCKR